MVELPNATTIDQTAQQLGQTSHTLYPAILLFIFFVFALGSYYSQERRLQRAKLSSSLVVGGLMSSITALGMVIFGGLIDIEVFYICAAITSGFALWNMFDND